MSPNPALPDLASTLRREQAGISSEWIHAVVAERRNSSAPILTEDALREFIVRVLSDLADVLSTSSSLESEASALKHAVTYGDARWFPKFPFHDLLWEIVTLRTIIIDRVVDYFLLHPRVSGETNRLGHKVVHRYFDALLLNSTSRFSGGEQDVAVSAALPFEKNREDDYDKQKRMKGLSDAVANARRWAFLAEASALLSSSLDYEVTLRHVAQLTVPAIADWCAIDFLQEDGSIEALVVAHNDPAKVDLANEVRQRYPIDPELPYGVTRVIRTGEAKLYPTVEPEMLKLIAHDEEHLRLMHEIGMRSGMIVPLTVAGRTFGAITLVSAESGRIFTTDDLALAENLASRAALSVENARLFKQSQERQQALLREQTERERASRALKDSEADFRALFEQAAVGMAQADPIAGRFRRVNRKMCEMLGYTEAELLHMNFREFTYPADRDRDYAGFQGVLESGGDLYTSEKRYVRKDGSVVWANVNVRIVRDPSGQPRDSFAVITDVSERKDAEQALKDRESQLRQIGDNLPDGFLYQVVAAPDGERRFVFFSAGVEPITGIPAEVALKDAKSLYSLIHPDDLPRIAAEEEQCIREGCSYQVIARLRHAVTGDWFWAQMRSARRILSNGESVWDGILLDVTKAKEIEDALVSSQERLSLAQKAGQIGVFDWNVQTGEVVWSEEEERIFGLKPGSFEGTIEGWKKRVHPGDIDGMRMEMQVAMDGKQTEMEFAFRIMREDQELRWIEGAARFIYNRSGTPQRMVGVNIDVTEARNARQNLENSEARLRIVVESASASGIGIVRSHADGQILETNEAFLRIVGYTMEDWAAGKINWTNMTPPECLALDERAVNELRADGKTRTFAKEYVRKDSSRVPVLLSLNFAPGTTDEFVCFVLDLTEQRKAEHELRQAKETAEAASKAKDHFLAVLSHELRTPLAPVVPLIEELIDRAELQAGFREDLQLIRRNIILESRLIDDLLDLTRILRDKMELRKEVVDIHELLGHTYEICQPEAVREKGVRIQIETGASEHHVWADPTRMQQVFWNLVNNACKFSRPGGVVAVRTFDAGAESVGIEITDQGVGIAPGLLPRLFQPFEQGDRHFGNERRGLGLGLAITKSLVEAHDGTIVVKSDGPGKGSTFRVMLPTADSKSANPVANAGANVSVKTGAAQTRKRILLVEDHLDTARVMERLLTGRGYEVQLATTMSQALTIGREHEFDLLVSDLGLPDGSGLEIMEELRKQREFTGIALSGFGTEADVLRSKEAGFSTHLVKPVNFEHLLRAIASLQ